MKDIFIFSYDLKDFLRDHRMWKIRKNMTSAFNRGNCYRL
ncbi:hypothetical protein B4129_0688 [Bacillus safensis]|nr:hypothetical protein B4129_0688 [Bacillus safensis]